MPRPNRDRVMVTFYLERDARQAIRDLAARRGETQADTVRALLAYALERMPELGAQGAAPAGRAPDTPQPAQA